MSATLDKTQKTTFVYSNLYHLYKKGRDAAQSADLSSPLATGRVLKAENAKDPAFKIEAFQPAEFLAKRLPQVSEAAAPAPQAPLKAVYAAKPSVLLQSQNQALTSLKDNLKSLNDLHARLRFMLKELEDLVKE